MKKNERNGQQFINPDLFNPKQVFKNIEAIMQAIAVSAVKQMYKTILESFVSMYESHFDIIRNTNEKSTNEEFEIAVNVTNFAHCDSVVEATMDNNWASRDGN